MASSVLTPSPPTSQDEVIEAPSSAMILRLQNLTLDVVSQLAAALEQPSSEACRRRGIELNLSQAVQGEASDDDPSQSQRRTRRKISGTYVFPSLAPRNTRALAQLFKVIESMHLALIEGVIVTKRSIYYRHPLLYGRQETVNRIVDRLCNALGTTTGQLGVCATSKGLFFGAVEIVDSAEPSESQGEVIARARAVPEPTKTYEIKSEAQWALVVEKDAVFGSLVDAGVGSGEGSSLAALGKGMVVTGKGYPDEATRTFLHVFAAKHPEVPLFALVDWDPHGFDIVRVYRGGSLGGDESRGRGVALPRLTRLNLGWQEGAGTSAKEGIQMLPLMDVDREKAVWLLRHSSTPEEERRQVCRMLQRGYKAEIEGSREMGGGNMTDRQSLVEVIVTALQRQLASRQVGADGPR